MGFNYLNGKNWSEITRDERFFCAHLYFEVLNNPVPFLKLLAEKNIIDSTEINENLWEVGYEVCFYRDLIFKLGSNGIHEISRTPFSQLRKRTFDLCFFSESQIIIIEAKAQQGFDTEQMGSFKSDIESVKQLIGYKAEVKLVGLAAARYKPKEQTRNNFSAIINWEQMYDCYPNDLFLKAEATFRK